MLRTVLDTDCLVLPDRLLAPGRITIDDQGRIAEIANRQPDRPDSGQPRRFLGPGLVDLQVNGFAGIDLLDTDESGFHELARALLHRGITAFLPTLISSPVPDLLERLETLSRWCIENPDTATPLGLHLEGPFLAPEARGTHRARDLRAPDPILMEEFLAAAQGRIRVVTLAPELPGALDLIESLSDQGVLVSLGHSRASYECTLEAADRGARMLTHFGNAMIPMHHRAPGLPGAGLVDPRLALGLIPDLLHVHPGILRLIWLAKGREGIVLVSDAIAAAGLEDGKYSFGDRRIQVEGGVCRDEEGRMAGSSLDLFEGLRRFLRSTEVSPCAGFQVASRNPARLLGDAEQRGGLRPGARADLLEMVSDDAGQLRLEAVYLAGRSISLH